MGYNLNNPMFSDIRVRQALNYAVDKQEIISIVLLGLGEVSSGPFVSQSWAYNTEVKPASFNQAKASELLKEAGYIDSDKDGWLEKDGRDFEFTLITNQGKEERINAAQIIQRRLKEIGIRMKKKVIGWSVFLTEYIEQKNFDAVLLGWSLGREPDNYDIWHSSKVRQGEFNFVGYRNERWMSYGIVVQCQNDRSQHKNKDHAMKQMRAKLYELELQKRTEAHQKLEDAKSDIGWGSQIRSYVLDQSRIKDLRTGVEVGNTQPVLDGDLDQFVEASLKQGW